MLKSMTGFGRAEKVTEDFSITVSIKSVNHRYIDINVRTPKHYNFVEERIRQSAMKCISRGKVEVSVTIEKAEALGKSVALDMVTAENYLNALRTLTQLGLEDDIRVSTLSRYSDIFKTEEDETDEEYLTALVDEVFSAAADDFISMRSSEGERMETYINERLDCLSENLEAVKARYPEIVREYRERLEKRIREVLQSENVDESRLITEAAIFAERSDIGEETVRLGSHIREFKNAMKVNGPIGKKLDFIVQEMNRETNTIGSKSGDIDIARYIVEMKSEIEKIREQIQNIE